MKTPVHLSPFLGARFLVVGLEQLGGGLKVTVNHVRHGKCECPALEADSDIEHLDHFLDGHGSYHRTPIGLPGHKSLSFELAQRLAHRDTTNAVALRKFFLAQLLAGLKLARKDRLSQAPSNQFWSGLLRYGAPSHSLSSGS